MFSLSRNILYFLCIITILAVTETVKLYTYILARLTVLLFLFQRGQCRQEGNKPQGCQRAKVTVTLCVQVTVSMYLPHHHRETLVASVLSQSGACYLCHGRR